jgi:hypothetical protein
MFLTNFMDMKTGLAGGHARAVHRYWQAGFVLDIEQTTLAVGCG